MLDEIFYFALHERRNEMLSLSSRWSNPLASSSQFNSQTNGARDMSERLSGNHPQTTLFWLSPTTINVQAPEDAPEEAHVYLTNSWEAAREPEHEVLADLLSEGSGLIEEDATDSELTVSATLLWELPEVCLILPTVYS